MDEHRSLSVTPDRYLTYRYAGASGDFNPIHLDDEFARSVGLPGRILHGLWTMSAGRPRADRGRGRAASRCARSRCSSAAWALPEREITISSTVREERDGELVDPLRRRAGRQADRPQRRGRGPARRPLTDLRPQGRLIRSTGCSPPPGAAAAQGRRRLPDDRPARGLEGARRRPRGRAPARRPIRNELAVLEEQGLLAHPHTSAGRVPTDAGYRYFVDELLPRLPAVPPGRARGSSSCAARSTRRCGSTTETLSQVTNLLAIVSAPPIGTTTIRHVEVLALQPQVLMVVIITSTGGVSKRVFTFERAVDPGLADWAAAYLNEQLVGWASARACCTRGSPTRRCDPTERALRRPSSRPRSPSSPRRPRTRSTSTAPRGCCPSTASRTSRSSTSCWRCSSAASRCSACCPRRSTSASIYVRIGAENADAGAAVARRSSPPTTGCRSATSAPSR